MAKELYIYSGIYDFVAESFLSKMEENKSEDITIRMNTGGGRVFAAWGMIAKMKEHKGSIAIKAEGLVASMGIPFLMYATPGKVSALDVTQFMIHRGDMFVESEEDKQLLATINADMRKKLNSRINNDKLKELKGYTIDELFDAEKRIDLWLDAKQAKAVGLIDSIISLNPKELESFYEKMDSLAAEQTPTITPKPITMTLDELKTKHPEIYAQVLKEGEAKENDRVCAWLTFVDVDPESVVKGVKDKKIMSQTEMVELTRKSFSPEALKKLEADKSKSIETPELPAGSKEKIEAKTLLDGKVSVEEVAASEKKLFELLNIKPN